MSTRRSGSPEQAAAAEAFLYPPKGRHFGSSLSLPPDELTAILKGNEPETFKIAEDALVADLLRKLTG
jgi:hypothetical protein